MFLFNFFGNVGNMIKQTSKVLFVLGSVISIIFGITFVEEKLWIMCLVHVFAIPFGLWIVSILFYGIGEMIENVQEIKNKIVGEEIENLGKIYSDETENPLVECPNCALKYDCTLERCPNCHEKNRFDNIHVYCPICGEKHDYNCNKCPNCNYEYFEKDDEENCETEE